jgi:hypothetical protein
METELKAKLRNNNGNVASFHSSHERCLGHSFAGMALVARPANTTNEREHGMPKLECYHRVFIKEKKRTNV